MRTRCLLAIACVLGLGVGIGLPTPSLAQGCGVGWSLPVVCELTISSARPREQWSTLGGEPARISVEPGGIVNLRLVALDQRRVPFPNDRLGLVMERSPSCERTVVIEDLDGGVLRFTAGDREGQCRLDIWLPGNMNFDRAVLIEVAAVPRSGYSEAEAAAVAARTYRAALGREGSRREINQAAAEIARGQLYGFLRSLVTSAEFRSVHRESPDSRIVRAFYQGLFDRQAERFEIDALRVAMGRQQYAEVLQQLITSGEFESRIAADLGVPERPTLQYRDDGD